MVVKRNGEKEPFDFNKILLRIRNLCALPEDMDKLRIINPEKYKLNQTLTPLTQVRYEEIAKTVISGIKNGMTTSELDDFAALIAQPLAFTHPEYGTLASRIAVSNYHKNNVYHLYEHFAHVDAQLTPEMVENRLFWYTIRALYENIDANGDRAPLVHPRIYQLVKANPDYFEKMLDYTRDYRYDFVGFKLLEETYLLRCALRNRNGKYSRVPIERPQHLIMRVALGIHCSRQYESWKYKLIEHAKVWNTMSGILREVMDEDLFEETARAYYAGNIDWSFICTRLSPEDARLLKSIVKENSITWEQLADKQSATLSDEETQNVVETYEYMSEMYMTHATPTLFNSGTLMPQLSSCYLIQPDDDSMRGITKYWADCAEISKWAGGIGSHVHNIRATNSYIRGTNGRSNGLLPMIKVVDDISVYVDQGGGKRPGSHAVYLGPEHPDFLKLIDAKRQRGNDQERARHLFYAAWLPDEFLRCVQEEVRLEALWRKEGRNEIPKLWYTMCPDQSPGLADVFDAELVPQYIPDDKVDPEKHAFTHLYRKYIKAGRYVANVSAQEIWRHVCEVIEETGVPYLCAKDAGNRKSNQQNSGTTKSSNLCTEIFQVSTPTETAVCNLASICLSRLVSAVKPADANKYYNAEGFDVRLTADAVEKRLWFDFGKLQQIVMRLVRNLNKVIDINYYPIPETKRSNFKHRPMGIGIQGLADLYTILRMPFDSEAAQKLNFYIFESIYYAALRASNQAAYSYQKNSTEILQQRIARLKDRLPRSSEDSLPEEEYQQTMLDLAKAEHQLKLISKPQGGAYASYPNSPISKGLLQFDLWEREQQLQGRSALLYPLSLDWTDLRAQITKHGVRNSLLIAPMPTGSTSTVMGCSACFEPHSSLIYKRRNRVGEYSIVNKYLISDLMELGLWNDEIRNAILKDSRGSIADVARIPRHVRQIYKTVWDVEPKALVDQALCRGVFVDQSQSMSLFMARPTHRELTKLHFYTWRRGIKTLSYYTRRLAPADAQKIQVVESDKKEKPEKTAEVEFCVPGNKECLSCQ